MSQLAIAVQVAQQADEAELAQRAEGCALLDAHRRLRALDAGQDADVLGQEAVVAAPAAQRDVEGRRGQRGPEQHPVAAPGQPAREPARAPRRRARASRGPTASRRVRRRPPSRVTGSSTSGAESRLAQGRGRVDPAALGRRATIAWTKATGVRGRRCRFRHGSRARGAFCTGTGGQCNHGRGSLTEPGIIPGAKKTMLEENAGAIFHPPREGTGPAFALPTRQLTGPTPRGAFGRSGAAGSGASGRERCSTR